MMQIEAKDIGVRRNGTTILDGVSLTVRPGELLGLIGPNGAGKSTLLRILANLQPADSGTILYAGQTAGETGRRALARRIAYLPQQGEVHWPMPVERVVALGRLAHIGLGGPGEADRQAVERALVRADLLPFRKRSIGTLSGGERMRVLLARALAVEAECLLADEPVTALDPLHQLQAMTLFAEAARGGAGVVVVLHDLTLAARFCDRLVLLSEARVLGEGDPESVLTEERVAEAFKVSLIRGNRDGRAYFVPWTAVDRDDRTESSAVSW